MIYAITILSLVVMFLIGWCVYLTRYVWGLHDDYCKQETAIRFLLEVVDTKGKMVKKSSDF